PLAVVLEPEPGDGRGVAARLTRGALLAAVPVAVFAAVCVGLGLEESVLAELRARNMETDSAPPIVAEALIKAVFPFAFWVWLGPARWGPREPPLAAWTILFLVVLVLTEAAGFLRSHLVALPAYAGLAVPGLAVLREQAGEKSLAAVAAGTTAISVASLLA